MPPFLGAFLCFLRIPRLPATSVYVLPFPPPPSLATGGRPSLHHLSPPRQSSPQPLPSPRPHRRPRLRLDGSLSGSSYLRPTWLKREDIAQMVFDCLHYAADQLRQFDLHAGVVMPNHVHVLLTPIIT